MFCVWFTLSCIVDAIWPTLHWNTVQPTQTKKYVYEQDQMIDYCHVLTWRGKADDIPGYCNTFVKGHWFRQLWTKTQYVMLLPQDLYVLLFYSFLFRLLSIFHIIIFIGLQPSLLPRSYRHYNCLFKIIYTKPQPLSYRYPALLNASLKYEVNIERRGTIFCILPPSSFAGDCISVPI